MLIRLLTNTDFVSEFPHSIILSLSLNTLIADGVFIECFKYQYRKVFNQEVYNYQSKLSTIEETKTLFMNRLVMNIQDFSDVEDIDIYLQRHKKRLEGERRILASIADKWPRVLIWPGTKEYEARTKSITNHCGCSR